MEALAQFADLPLLAQIGFSVLLLWLLVGSFVVMSFVLDVLIAAARAASLTALDIRAQRGTPGKISIVRVLSCWRSRLFMFYEKRRVDVTVTLNFKDMDVARWHGIFRWEFIKPGEQTSEVTE